MKKIASGWQCDVYDLGNGKVIKTQKPYISKFFKVLHKGSFLEILGGAIPRVRKDYSSSLKKMQNIISSSGIDPAFLCNPEINTQELFYIQDKVTPFYLLMKDFSLEESKEFFNNYARLLKYLWGFGVHDKIFNFRKNAGIDSEGRVVLIDIGELAFKKEKVERNIKTKRWLRANSYLKTKDKKLRNYYKNLMDKELTIDALNSLWRKKID